MILIELNVNWSNVKLLVLNLEKHSLKVLISIISWSQDMVQGQATKSK